MEPRKPVSIGLEVLLWTAIALSTILLVAEMTGFGRVGSGGSGDELLRRFLDLADTITTASATLCLTVAAVGLYLGSLRRD